MPFKKGVSGNPSRQFSKSNQPPGENKSKGHKRISDIKEALSFFGEQLKETVKLDNGTSVELTYESNIGFVLLQAANAGDLKAIQILADLKGWNAPKDSNVNFKGSVSVDEWLASKSE